MTEEDSMEVEYYGEQVTGEYKPAPPLSKIGTMVVDSLTDLNEAFLFGTTTRRIERSFRASLRASRERRALERKLRRQRVVVRVTFLVLFIIAVIGGMLFL